MRNRIAVVAAGLAMLGAPAVGVAQPVKGHHKQELYTATDRQPYEERYLDVRERYVDEFGAREAGRDIVRNGFREGGGDVRPPTRSEVVRSTERMQRALNPPAPAPAPQAEAEAEATTESTGGAATATAQCESGGVGPSTRPATTAPTSSTSRPGTPMRRRATPAPTRRRLRPRSRMQRLRASTTTPGRTARTHRAG